LFVSLFIFLFVFIYLFVCLFVCLFIFYAYQHPNFSPFNKYYY
jgi:hypothetical protein